MSGRMNTCLDRELWEVLSLHFYFLKEVRKWANYLLFWGIVRFVFFYKECICKWVDRVVSSCQPCSGVAPQWHHHGIPSGRCPKSALSGTIWEDWSRLLSLCNQLLFWLYSKVKSLCVLCFSRTLSSVLFKKSNSMNTLHFHEKRTS